jgi:hypothetical protein
LISIEPEIGSIGGSKIIVTGSGFGTEVTDLNLYDSTNDRTLCSSFEVISYGVFTCVTILEAIDPSTDVIQI